MIKSVKAALLSSSRAKWLDPFFLLLSLLVLIFAVFITYKWTAISVYLKFVIEFVSALLIIFFLALTKKGISLFKFSKEARAELKKVHWPLRQETMQTTLIVVVMVVVVGLFLWGVDGLFIWLINALTGQRG